MHVTGRAKTSLVNITESVFGYPLKRINCNIYYEFQVGILQLAKQLYHFFYNILTWSNCLAFVDKQRFN